MIAGRGTAAAAQHPLAAHELAVVFTEVAVKRTEARVGAIGAGGPLPDIAEQLPQPTALPRPWVQVIVVGKMAARGLRRSGGLPLELAGQACSGPAGAGVGLVVAEVADRRMRIQLAPTTEGVLALQGIVPVQRVLPALGFTQRPAFAEPPARFAVPPASMKARYSALLTGRSASACAGSSTRCGGDSLS